MKLLVRVAILFVILFLTFLAFKNQVLKTVVVWGADAGLNLKVEIDRFDLSLNRTFLQLDDVTIHQPPAFENEMLVELAHLYVDYNLESFWSGRPHLEELNLNIKEFRIIRNSKGELNIGTLKMPELPPVKIDRFYLKLDSIVFKDYTFAKQAFDQVFKVQIEEEYRDLESLDMAVRIILAKAVRNSTIARLTNLNPGTFVQDNVFDVMTVTNRVVTKAAGTVEKKIGDAGNTVQEKAKSLMGAVKEGVSAPFKGNADTANGTAAPSASAGSENKE